jgi:hypothetical protein
MGPRGLVHGSDLCGSDRLARRELRRQVGARDRNLPRISLGCHGRPWLQGHDDRPRGPRRTEKLGRPRSGCAHKRCECFSRRDSNELLLDCRRPSWKRCRHMARAMAEAKTHLDRSGKMVLYNSHLWKIPEWHDQTGLMWVAQNALDGMVQQVFEEPPPGMIICGYD